MGRHLVQLTHYCLPQEKIPSRYGWISWKEYIIRERERIASSPNREAEVRYMHSGKLALYVNDVGINQDIERKKWKKNQTLMI